MSRERKDLFYFIASILLFSNTIFAQTGRIEYSFTSPYDYGLKTQNAILYFNPTESLFIYNKIGMDSVQSGTSLEMIDKGKNSGVYIKASLVDKKGAQVYRNFKTKSIFFRITKEKPLEPYIVQDDWLPIDWRIKPQYKNIGGFKCQKAIAEFRGRTFIAWFTIEIPLSYGPWKLFGLPGLILQARTDDGKFESIFKTLCYPCDEIGVEIKKPYEKELKTMKEYVYFVMNHGKHMTKKMNASVPDGVNITFTLTDPKTKHDIIDIRNKYRLERLYGWEEYPGDTNNLNTDQSGNKIDLETMPESIQIEAEDGKLDKYPIEKSSG